MYLLKNKKEQLRFIAKEKGKLKREKNLKNRFE